MRCEIDASLKRRAERDRDRDGEKEKETCSCNEKHGALLLVNFDIHCYSVFTRGDGEVIETVQGDCFVQLYGRRHYRCYIRVALTNINRPPSVHSQVQHTQYNATLILRLHFLVKTSNTGYKRQSANIESTLHVPLK